MRQADIIVRSERSVKGIGRFQGVGMVARIKLRMFQLRRRSALCDSAQEVLDLSVGSAHVV